MYIRYVIRYVLRDSEKFESSWRIPYERRSSWVVGAQEKIL